MTPRNEMKESEAASNNDELEKAASEEALSYEPETLFPEAKYETTKGVYSIRRRTAFRVGFKAGARWRDAEVERLRAALLELRSAIARCYGTTDEAELAKKTKSPFYAPYVLCLRALTPEHVSQNPDKCDKSEQRKPMDFWISFDNKVNDFVSVSTRPIEGNHRYEVTHVREVLE